MATTATTALAVTPDEEIDVLTDQIEPPPVKRPKVPTDPSRRNRGRRKVQIDLSLSAQQRLDVFLRQENVIVNEVNVPIPVHDVALPWSTPSTSTDTPKVEMFDGAILRWAQSDAVALDLDPLAHAGVWTEDEIALRRLQRQVQLRYLYEQEYLDFQQQLRELNQAKNLQAARLTAAAAAAALGTSIDTSSPTSSTSTQLEQNFSTVSTAQTAFNHVNVSSSSSHRLNAIPNGVTNSFADHVESATINDGINEDETKVQPLSSTKPRQLLAIRKYGIRRRLTAAISRVLPRQNSPQRPPQCCYGLDTKSTSVSTNQDEQTPAIEASASSLKAQMASTANAACVLSALPFSRYCTKHILLDKTQRLYVCCVAQQLGCTEPVLRYISPAFCRAHRYLGVISQSNGSIHDLPSANGKIVDIEALPEQKEHPSVEPDD